MRQLRLVGHADRAQADAAQDRLLVARRRRCAAPRASRWKALDRARAARARRGGRRRSTRHRHVEGLARVAEVARCARCASSRAANAAGEQRAVAASSISANSALTRARSACGDRRDVGAHLVDDVVGEQQAERREGRRRSSAPARCRMPSSAACMPACTGPLPPYATSVSSRGSTPRVGRRRGGWRWPCWRSPCGRCRAAASTTVEAERARGSARRSRACTASRVERHARRRRSSPGSR